MKRCAFACAFPSTRRACAEVQALAGALWLAPEAAALAATPHLVRAGPAEDAAVTLRAARVNVAMTATLSLLLAAVASPLVDRV